MQHVQTWVFDLDNTLYPPSARLFDQIEHRMEQFIMRELGCDLVEARALRARYWRDHGTTLAGLMTHHRIDPAPFLHEVHDIDLAALTPDPGLADALAALPGRRLIYTNGSRAHGERVSRARGVRHTFEAIYGVEDAGFRPKPERIAFDRVFERAGIDPARAVMVEDDPRNLLAPAEMGMVTVLVDPERGAHGPHVQHVTDDLAAFLRGIV